MPDGVDRSPQAMGLLLAAGYSRRFGSDKLAARVPGPPDGAPQSVLQMSAQSLIAACPLSVAVVRHGSAHCATLHALGFDVVELDAPQAQARPAGEPVHEPGLGDSIAAGARRLIELRASGCVLLLGDLPFVQTATVAAVRSAVEAGASIAVACHQGQRGHPVGFAAQHLPSLTQLTGDEGARTLLQTHAQQLQMCDVNDPGALRDIDRPEDLQLSL
jgi:molybdenum cofactor cytidylyltransferase